MIDRRGAGDHNAAGASHFFHWREIHGPHAIDPRQPAPYTALHVSAKRGWNH